MQGGKKKLIMPEIMRRLHAVSPAQPAMPHTDPHVGRRVLRTTAILPQPVGRSKSR